MSKENPIKVILKKKYEYFDENFELQTKEVLVEFTLIGPVYPDNATAEQKAAIDQEVTQSALAELNRINDFVGAANFLIRREALKNARLSAGISGGINRAVLMEFIKPYREAEPFASMISATDKRKATAEEWDKQTKAIIDQIKNVPFMVNSIKALSAKANETEDSE